MDKNAEDTHALSDLPPIDAVDAEITRLGWGVSASELHGALCGWLCGGGHPVREWPAKVLADDAIPAAPVGSPLDLLREGTASQLADRTFGFELLMPPGDQSLAVRSGALFDWCRGFLGAFGLAAGDRQKLSEESTEALGDLARLATGEAQEEGGDEEEEALVEIEEFVRVAALLLHGDCVLASEHRQRLN